MQTQNIITQILTLVSANKNNGAQNENKANSSFDTMLHNEVSNKQKRAAEAAQAPQHMKSQDSSSTTKTSNNGGASSTNSANNANSANANNKEEDAANTDESMTPVDSIHPPTLIDYFQRIGLLGKADSEKSSAESDAAKSDISKLTPGDGFNLANGSLITANGVIESNLDTSGAQIIDGNGVRNVSLTAQTSVQENADMTAAEAMKAMKSDAIDLTNTRAHKHAHATSETKDLSAGAKAVKLNANALSSVDTKKSFKVDTTLLSGKLQTANDKTTVIAPAKNTDFKTNLTQASQVQNLPVQPASTKSKDSASLTGININATTAQNIASGTSKIIEKNQDNQKETANKEKGQAESLTVADNAQSLQSENPVSNVNESNQPFNADEKPIAMQKFDVNLKGQISSLEAKQVKVEEKLAAAPRVEATPAQQNVMLAEQVKATATPNHIAPQVGKSGWDQALGQKVMWMVAGGDQVAQLTLNPPDLGPLQVVLSISDSQVDASFVSAHLDVREAIEAAAPKLKEMMDSAGIQLSGFSVSSQSAGSQNQMADGRPFTSGIFKQNTTSESSTPIKLTSAPVKNQVKPGGIDTFV